MRLAGQIAIFVLWLVGAPTSVIAQSTLIPTKAGKFWVHRQSGVALPGRIDGFQRIAIEDNSGSKQIDVDAAFKDSSTETVATVYIFRPTLRNPAVWFEMSTLAVSLSNRYGTLSSVSGPLPMNLGTGFEAAGIAESFTITKLGRSTGVAVRGVGPWLVALRMTSSQLDEGQLSSTMTQFLSQLGWPIGKQLGSSQFPILECKESVSLLARGEKQAQSNSGILVGAALGKVENDKLEKAWKTGEATPSDEVCRDSVAVEGHAVFRLTGDTNGYVIPLDDAGTILSVNSDNLTKVVIESSGPVFRISVRNPTKWTQFPIFDRLVPPEQALDVVRNEAPTSISSFDGKKMSIQLDPTSFH